MEDIRLYDFEFNLLHIENKVVSANPSIFYNDIGTFEYHFPLNSDVTPIIMEHEYLVLVQGSRQAIITGKNLYQDCTVFGRTCNWILTRRTTPAFKASELEIGRDSESIARWVVSQAFSDVDNFVLGEECGMPESEDFGRETTCCTYDVVRDVLAREDAGHRVIFDTGKKQWRFEVYRGENLPLIVSEMNRNAYESEYDINMLDYYTSGYYEYQPEQEEGQEAPPKQWGYVAGDKTGIYKWDAVLSGEDESEAKSDLLTKRVESRLTTKVRDIRCGVDYNIGDVVRIQLQTGGIKREEKKRIIGVNYHDEQNNSTEMPVFEE